MEDITKGKLVVPRSNIYETTKTQDSIPLKFLSKEKAYEIIDIKSDKVYYIDDLGRTHEILKASAWRLFNIDRPTQE